MELTVLTLRYTRSCTGWGTLGHVLHALDGHVLHNGVHRLPYTQCQANESIKGLKNIFTFSSQL